MEYPSWAQSFLSGGIPAAVDDLLGELDLTTYQEPATIAPKTQNPTTAQIAVAPAGPVAIPGPSKINPYWIAGGIAVGVVFLVIVFKGK